jgi:hypothetical protein
MANTTSFLIATVKEIFRNFGSRGEMQIIVVLITITHVSILAGS